MMGGYSLGCAAFRALAQVTAPSTLTSPNSQSTTPAPSGLLPFTSIWTCGMPGNLANPAADHSYFPLIYPATRSVPWIGMSVGVVLSRMIRVIFPPVFDLGFTHRAHRLT